MQDQTSQITKEQLISERSRLLEELSFIEGWLEKRYSWSADAQSPRTRVRSRPNRVEAPPIKTETETKIATDYKKPDTDFGAVPYGELSEEWVDVAAGTVTIRDFHDWLLERYDEEQINRNSLSAPMRRLVDDGKLIVTRQGKGRAPTIYEVADSDL